jgi:uncharacterized protein YgbK (DUF1537 family)
VESSSPTWTVVLDDDPTGTQGLANVPVVVRPSEETFEWAYSQGPVTYVLTNTRALDPAAAREVVANAATHAAAVAATHGSGIRFISRGDSTLRGHFPLEVEALAEYADPGRLRGCILVPSFPAAGRFTIDGIHVVDVAGTRVPVALTEYATDATFGFDQSDLVAWARTRIPVGWNAVHLISSVVDEGPTAVARFLSQQRPFTVVCPSVRHEVDLSVIAAGQRIAAERGHDFLVQAGPAYPRHLAGLQLAVPVPIDIPASAGLIVVGSHTETTTAQLEHLRGELDVHWIELNVGEIVAGRAERELERCAGHVVSLLAAGTVVLSTSRRRVTGDTAASSLRIAKQVADALLEVTRRALNAHPGFVIAKGGITSRDVLAEALGWQAATVVGPLVDQTLPVWESWRPTAGVRRCVIFPGNVGDEALLARAVQRLSGREPERVSA